MSEREASLPGRRAAELPRPGLGIEHAGSLKDARLKTVRAQQAADITRSQPQLGYDLALSGVQGQILKNRMV